jgi:hypothetical protein
LIYVGSYSGGACHDANFSIQPTIAMRMPVCPSCIKLMRLHRGAPDWTYTNLRHVMFVCENCGRASEFSPTITKKPRPLPAGRRYHPRGSQAAGRSPSASGSVNWMKDRFCGLCGLAADPDHSVRSTSAYEGSRLASFPAEF